MNDEKYQEATEDFLHDDFTDIEVPSNTSHEENHSTSPLRLTHDEALSQQDFSSLEELDTWEDGWQRNNFAHVKIPSAFLYPYTMTTKDGREFDKAYVSIPQGTKINGVNIGGFSCDVFMSDYMKQQQLNGSQVTLSFRGNQPVTIWTGKKDSEQYPYKQFQVKPWELVKGIKQQLDGYKESQAAQRSQSHDKAAQNDEVKSSLEDAVKESRSASQVLSGEKDASAIDNRDNR